jgi:phage-related baseplate assembly protein
MYKVYLNVYIISLFSYPLRQLISDFRSTCAQKRSTFSCKLKVTTNKQTNKQTNKKNSTISCTVLQVSNFNNIHSLVFDLLLRLVSK